MFLRQIKWFLQFLGNLENSYSIGTNKLIKNGARLITNVYDILENYPEFSNRNKRIIRSQNNKIKDEYKEIYSCLNDEFTNLDKIVIKSRKTLREVINVLTLMEIDKKVEFKSGLGYRKKEI